MRHINVLLGFCAFVAGGCEPPPKAPDASGTTAAADSSAMDTGGPSTSAPDPATTSGAVSSDGVGDSSDGGDAAPPVTTSGTTADTGSSSGDEDTSSGSEDGSSSGSGSGGGPMQGACDPNECVTDCGFSVPDSDMGFGACWAPVADYEPWACDVQTICPEVYVSGFVDEDAASASACLLDALAADTVGRVSYWFGPDEYDNRWGSIFIVGDGTVLLDLYTGGHCGNGGSYGTRPFRTRAMSIDHASAALNGCADSVDPDEVVTCAFGSEFADPDSMPWLTGACVDSEPVCPE